MRDTVKDPAIAAFKSSKRGPSGSPARSDSKNSDVGGEYGLEGVIYEVDADKEVTTNKEGVPYDPDLDKIIAEKTQSSKEPFSFGAAESVKVGSLLREKKQPEPVFAGKYQELNEDYPTERETEKFYKPRNTFNMTEDEKILE